MKEKLVSLNRVAKVYQGRSQVQFRCCGGDRRRSYGTIGHGLGKAREVSEAIGKAVKDAEKNLIKVPLLNGTIPHEAHGKYGAGKALIKPAAHGTGVIAGGAMRAVLEMAGVQDVLAKTQGSSNPHNVVKATIDALHSLRSPAEVARQRGISMEKLFNG